ncbi:MAG: M20/M25/M40 family metallo-hydrolase, partial [Deltaproteobacteria bacterium]|nr:M20/M25/M40 family metallo-hydrolase [Deltaproteobacteria bacterium]
MGEPFLGTIQRAFQDSVTHTLSTYITIPNLSPLFDKDWATAGHMDRAVNLLVDWTKAQQVPGLKVEVVRLPSRTPLILVEIDGQGPDTVLMYGHLDKQPPFEGWDDGLGAFKPVLRGERLYGRGGADDGYALFASVLAVKLLKQGNIPHARCLILIEAGEESGSPDLPAYIEHLEARIGQPSLIVCLDSGCGNYEQLWATSSLRGLIGGELSVSLLREGVHSGDGSGVVASSFRVLRSLLARVDDDVTGVVKLPELHAPIPAARITQARAVADALGDSVHQQYPTHAGVR